jgi:hypothetical protein
MITYDANGNVLYDSGTATPSDSGTATPGTPSTTPWYAAPIAAITGVYQAKQLMDINAQRAVQGLPPVDASALAPTVNVGLPPAQMQQIMMLGGAALLIFFLMSRKGRK